MDELKIHHEQITDRYASLARQKSYSTSKTEVFIVMKCTLDYIIPAFDEMLAKIELLDCKIDDLHTVVGNLLIKQQ